MTSYSDFLSEVTATLGEDSPLVDDVARMVTGEEIVSYFIRPETLFDDDSVFKAVMITVLTPTRLLFIGTDVSFENIPYGEEIVSSQMVRLSAINDYKVMRTRAASGPDAGSLITDGVRVRWGGTATLDLRPGMCEDPTCDADHGMRGIFISEDAEVTVDPSLDEDTRKRGSAFIDTLILALAQASAAAV